MVVVLLAICGAMLLVRWAANDLGLSSDKRKQPDRKTRSGRYLGCCNPTIRLSDDRYVPADLEV